MSQQQQQTFTVGLAQPQQQLQNMRLDYAADATAVYATPTPTYHPPTPTVQVSNNINGGAADSSQGQRQGQGQGPESMKRKRGRPKKYGPDATLGSAFTPTSPTPVSVTVNPSASSSAAGPPFSPASKKARGRPRGSGTKPRFRALGAAGVSIIPHVITVKAGEDLAAKILSLSQKIAKNVCILTATGCISNVTLRQPDASGATVTYEGRFEILTLGGSLLLTGNGGQPHRYGGLNVSLSGPDGRVLGGGVAGLLIAASPVQIILGSFLEEDSKASNLASQVENLSAPPDVATAGQSSSPSRGTLSESSGGPGSPLNQGTGACNNNNAPQGVSGMPWK